MAVWRSVPIPVADRLFAPVRRIDGPPRMMFVGRSTPHREAFLGRTKGEFDVLHVAFGMGAEALTDAMSSHHVAINIHNEPYPSFENRVCLHLAAGHLVMSETLSPTHGLEPGIDYLEVQRPDELLRIARNLSRFPTRTTAYASAADARRRTSVPHACGRGSWATCFGISRRSVPTGPLRRSGVSVAAGGTARRTGARSTRRALRMRSSPGTPASGARRRAGRVPGCSSSSWRCAWSRTLSMSRARRRPTARTSRRGLASDRAQRRRHDRPLLTPRGHARAVARALARSTCSSARSRASRSSALAVPPRSSQSTTSPLSPCRDVFLMAGHRGRRRRWRPVEGLQRGAEHALDARQLQQHVGSA